MLRSSIAAAVLIVVLGASIFAQEGVQRGKIKKADPEKGVVTIMVEGSDKDQVFVIDADTKLRDANNKEITNFKEKGIPAGTAVMFKAQRRGGKMVLWGLKLAEGAGGKGPAGNRPPPAPPPRESIGVKPLTELGEGTYKGETGGLYGDGRNDPPDAHAKAAGRETAKIRPLDAEGRPSPAGKIALLAIGMSNTTQEFSLFKTNADRDPQKSPQLVIVDGAQGGKAAEEWADPASDVGREVWKTVDSRIKAAGVTAEQVQVVWIKQALIRQGRFGEFPAHARKLEGELAQILRAAKKHFPNLRVAYLSSRIYAGYATTPLNPEPYAYEGAYSIRWLIQSQIKGDEKLNYDPDRGPVTAPLALWGPYLWGDGTTPRKDDGLVWKREDLREDGTHPSDSGRKNVADLLLNFFKTDENARHWFLKSP